MPFADDFAFPYLTEEERFVFPDARRLRGGVAAQGGNLSPGMLLSAYEQGVFPWFSPQDPITWWSPDPRFVVFPQDFHIGKRLSRTLKKSPFTVTVDSAFCRVIQNCADIPREKQDGTWITADMITAYSELFRLGYAHSAEAWLDGKLAGGLYGVLIGRIFCGESMFSAVSGASKAAFSVFMRRFIEAGGLLVDSQVYTDYVASFGGKNISRQSYLLLLRKNIEQYGSGAEFWAKIAGGFSSLPPR